MKINKNEKGIVSIIILIIVIFVVAGYVIFKAIQVNKSQNSLSNNMPVPTQYGKDYTTSSQKVAPINNKSDLDKTSAEVDSTNTTSLDTELNSLNSDSNF